MNKLYLIRHGETAWSKSSQHTSYTDLSLTDFGIEQTIQLLPLIPSFQHVFISPLKRARQTADLLKLKGSILQELTEWNYGIYEGKTTAEIQKTEPNWNIFTHGALFGETIEEVRIRALKTLSLCSALEGSVCLITSGHFTKMLISCYLDQPPDFGRHLIISTASLSLLSVDRDVKVIEKLNIHF